MALNLEQANALYSARAKNEAIGHPPHYLNDKTYHNPGFVRRTPFLLIVEGLAPEQSGGAATIRIIARHQRSYGLFQVIYSADECSFYKTMKYLGHEGRRRGRILLNDVGQPFLVFGRGEKKGAFHTIDFQRMLIPMPSDNSWLNLFEIFSLRCQVSMFNSNQATGMAALFAALSAHKTGSPPPSPESPAEAAVEPPPLVRGDECCDGECVVMHT
jgi:hypothetical protein